MNFWAKVKKPVLYLISSGFIGLLYLGILFVLRTILHRNLYVSVSAAYLFSMTVYFLFNRKVVFQKTGQGFVKEVILFALLTVFNYLLTLLIVAGVHHYTHEVYSGSVLAGIVTVTLTYFVFDRLLFHKQD